MVMVVHGNVLQVFCDPCGVVAPVSELQHSLGEPLMV